MPISDAPVDLRSNDRELTSIYELLLAHHGPQSWWPADSAFEIMAGAILIQRTTWMNAERALSMLRERHWLTPEAIVDSAEAQLQACIRSAGFFRQKSQRLKALSGWLIELGGIEAVGRLDDGSLRAALLDLSGVGPETADVICLYAFERRQFVVDAYARRLFSRLGLVDGDEPYAQLQARFHQALPRERALYNEYHALIVEHAKVHCRSAPRCEGCVLATRCRSCTLPATH